MFHRFEYLLVLGICLIITLPLELFLGARIYAQPKRLLVTVVPVFLGFTLWDVFAIRRHHWWFNDKFVTGFRVGNVPIEEMCFFIVIPLCVLLTYAAVGSVLCRRKQRSRNA